MSIQLFNTAKSKGQKISMITCYDYWSARLLNDSPINALLVGDSLGMVMHGYPTTVNATMEMMILHVQAVVRGAPDKLIIGDLPFMSYRMDFATGVRAATQIMQAGAHAVKLEGARGNEKLVAHLVESGIPVMGHLGLTPQSIHQLGGFKVQARKEEQALQLLKDAQSLEACGAFSVVLECVPADVAKHVTSELNLPTIGIGAGPHCDGQVLVLQDMLGLSGDFKPKFLRTYIDGAAALGEAFKNYHNDVQSGTFPNADESY